MKDTGLGSDSIAMRKLDTLIEKDNPYEKEAGGVAYLAKERKENSVIGLYQDKNDIKDKEKKREASNMAIVVIVCAIIIAAVIVVALL